ncbi:hypothetical protein RI129_006136 [Pyrocoelia pectoralis]|uniref:Uncharacterized protein n=1 Tax=Pyrocoelia pectoralis TaxID=417401 RepID=A0AAN7VGQ4_9COLE
MLTTVENSENEELTVDYLFATYKHNEQMVDSLSLTEIHNLELAMPIFNTLASLTKSDFNLFMSNLKKKNQDTDVLLILITAVTDTLTCMVKSYTFYEGYSQGNKQTFYLLFKLLEIIKDIVVLERLEHHRLIVVIKILQKCSTRIKFEEDVYNKMLNIITQLKNKLDVEEIESIKENIDIVVPLTTQNNNVVNVKSACIKKEEVYELPTKKAPLNAFEVLMRSSKIKKNKK